MAYIAANKERSYAPASGHIFFDPKKIFEPVSRSRW